MCQKMTNINCRSYKGGVCTHQAAPSRWFGPARCILVEAQDIRIARVECSFKTEHFRRAADELTPPPKKP